MRLIPTRTHGYIDYVFGLLLIVSPWLFGFAIGGVAQWLPVILGALVIVYSLLTDYELGLARAIPMPVHLGLDVAGGVLLAASPWLFGFSAIVFLPHLVLGIVEIVTALMTKTRPENYRVGAIERR